MFYLQLKFLGNGSGFTTSHNNAYFNYDDNIVFIDLSLLNLEKALEVQKNYKEVFILVTHMHDDHVSGIPLFAQYLYYLYNKKLRVIVPSMIYEDMLKELKIKGINDTIIIVDEIISNYLFIEEVVPTKHANELENKCFGYVLNIGSKVCIYTGDTCDLSDFHFELSEGCDEFYVDVSYDYGVVHLKWDDIKEELNKIAKSCKVYLMHLDNKEKFENLILGENIYLTFVEPIT